MRPWNCEVVNQKEIVLGNAHLMLVMQGTATDVAIL
jgi:hypothetical protein